MLAFVWPHFLEPISWLWINPSSYNLWSSSFGEIVLKLPLVVWALRHLNCKVDGCWRVGHPVHGTGYRACRRHHPAMKSAGPITAEEIAAAHRAHRIRSSPS
jgi:hypothetical protein